MAAVAMMVCPVTCGTCSPAPGTSKALAAMSAARTRSGPTPQQAPKETAKHDAPLTASMGRLYGAFVADAKCSELIGRRTLQMTFEIVVFNGESNSFVRSLLTFKFGTNGVAAGSFEVGSVEMKEQRQPVGLLLGWVFALYIAKCLWVEGVELWHEKGRACTPPTCGTCSTSAC
jgi:hypothetical protein